MPQIYKAYIPYTQILRHQTKLYSNLKQTERLLYYLLEVNFVYYPQAVNSIHP